MLYKPRQCRLMGYVICQMTHINNQTLDNRLSGMGGTICPNIRGAVSITRPSYYIYNVVVKLCHYMSFLIQ